MELYRSVSLGYLDASLAGDLEDEALDPFPLDSGVDEPFVSWGSEESSDDLLGESWKDGELSDVDSSEDLEWSPDDEDRSYFSSITLRGFSTSKEKCSIGLTSRLAAEGHCSSSETPSEARRYERDGLFMSVEFEGGAGDVHPNDAVKRFALVREVAKKLGLFNFPARGRFLADLEDSRRQALLEGMTEEDGFGVDYLWGRVMVHAKRFPWPGT